jgi:hypothetical protein
MYISQFYSYFKQDKKTPLHMGADSGFAEVCNLLLGLRADANASDAVRFLNIEKN